MSAPRELLSFDIGTKGAQDGIEDLIKKFKELDDRAEKTAKAISEDLAGANVMGHLKRDIEKTDELLTRLSNSVSKGVKQINDIQRTNAQMNMNPMERSIDNVDRKLAELRSELELTAKSFGELTEGADSKTAADIKNKIVELRNLITMYGNLRVEMKSSLDASVKSSGIDNYISALEKNLKKVEAGAERAEKAVRGIGKTKIESDFDEAIKSLRTYEDLFEKLDDIIKSGNASLEQQNKLISLRDGLLDGAKREAHAKQTLLNSELSTEQEITRQKEIQKQLDLATKQSNFLNSKASSFEVRQDTSGFSKDERELYEINSLIKQANQGVDERLVMIKKLNMSSNESVEIMNQIKDIGDDITRLEQSRLAVQERINESKKKNLADQINREINPFIASSSSQTDSLSAKYQYAGLDKARALSAEIFRDTQETNKTIAAINRHISDNNVDLGEEQRLKGIILELETKLETRTKLRKNIQLQITKAAQEEEAAKKSASVEKKVDSFSAALSRDRLSAERDTAQIGMSPLEKEQDNMVRKIKEAREYLEDQRKELALINIEEHERLRLTNKIQEAEKEIVALEAAQAAHLDNINRKKAAGMMRGGRDQAQFAPDLSLYSTLQTAIISAGIAFYTMRQAIAETVSVGANFEHQMIKFGALGETTSIQVKKLSDQIKGTDLAIENLVTTLPETAIQFTKIGFTAKESIASLEGVAKAALATGESVEAIAPVVAGVMNQFGIGAGEVERVTNVLVKTSLMAKTTVGEMATAIQYIGPTAKMSGMSLEDMATSIVLLNQSGITLSKTGNALDNALTRLRAPAGKASQLLKSLGVDLKAMDGDVGKNWFKIIEQLRQGLSKYSTRQQAPMIKEIFGDTGSTAILTMLNKSKDQIVSTSQDINRAVKENLVDKISEQMEKGLLSLFIRLNNEFDKLKIAMTEASTGQLTALLDTAINLVKWIGELSDATKSWIGTFAISGTAAAGLTVILGSVGLALYGIKSGIAVVMPAIRNLWTFMKLLTGGAFMAGATITTVIVALAGLAWAWETHHKNLDNEREAWENYRDAVNETKGAIDEYRKARDKATEAQLKAALVEAKLNMVEEKNRADEKKREADELRKEVDKNHPDTTTDAAGDSASTKKRPFARTPFDPGLTEDEKEKLRRADLLDLQEKNSRSRAETAQKEVDEIDADLKKKQAENKEKPETPDAPDAPIADDSITAFEKIKNNLQKTNSQLSILMNEAQKKEKEEMAKTKSVSYGSLQQAFPGMTPTSKYGWRGHPIHGGRRMHHGEDLGAPTGTPIRALRDGVVSFADWQGGYGKQVKVLFDAAKKMEDSFSHMSNFAVKQGQQVKKGDVLGYVGSTGYATGPHLHWEVRVNGVPIDPKSTMGMGSTSSGIQGKYTSAVDQQRKAALEKAISETEAIYGSAKDEKTKEEMKQQVLSWRKELSDIDKESHERQMQAIEDRRAAEQQIDDAKYKNQKDFIEIEKYYTKDRMKALEDERKLELERYDAETEKLFQGFKGDPEQAQRMLVERGIGRSNLEADYDIKSTEEYQKLRKERLDAERNLLGARQEMQSEGLKKTLEIIKAERDANLENINEQMRNTQTGTETMWNLYNTYLQEKLNAEKKINKAILEDSLDKIAIQKTALDNMMSDHVKSAFEEFRQEKKDNKDEAAKNRGLTPNDIAAIKKQSELVSQEIDLIKKKIKAAQRELAKEQIITTTFGRDESKSILGTSFSRIKGSSVIGTTFDRGRDGYLKSSIVNSRDKDGGLQAGSFSTPFSDGTLTTNKIIGQAQAGSMRDLVEYQNQLNDAIELQADLNDYLLMVSDKELMNLKEQNRQHEIIASRINDQITAMSTVLDLGAKIASIFSSDISNSISWISSTMKSISEAYLNGKDDNIISNFLKQMGVYGDEAVKGISAGSGLLGGSDSSGALAGSAVGKIGSVGMSGIMSSALAGTVGAIAVGIPALVDGFMAISEYMKQSAIDAMEMKLAIDSINFNELQITMERNIRNIEKGGVTGDEAESYISQKKTMLLEGFRNQYESAQQRYGIAMMKDGPSGMLKNQKQLQLDINKATDDYNKSVNALPEEKLKIIHDHLSNINSVNASIAINTAKITNNQRKEIEESNKKSLNDRRSQLQFAIDQKSLDSNYKDTDRIRDTEAMRVELLAIEMDNAQKLKDFDMKQSQDRIKADLDHQKSVLDIGRDTFDKKVALMRLETEFAVKEIDNRLKYELLTEEQRARLIQQKSDAIRSGRDKEKETYEENKREFGLYENDLVNKTKLINAKMKQGRMPTTSDGKIDFGKMVYTGDIAEVIESAKQEYEQTFIDEDKERRDLDKFGLSAKKREEADLKITEYYSALRAQKKIDAEHAALNSIKEQEIRQLEELAKPKVDLQEDMIELANEELEVLNRQSQELENQLKLLELKKRQNEQQLTDKDRQLFRDMMKEADPMANVREGLELIHNPEGVFTETYSGKSKRSAIEKYIELEKLKNENALLLESYDETSVTANKMKYLEKAESLLALEARFYEDQMKESISSEDLARVDLAVAEKQALLELQDLTLEEIEEKVAEYRKEEISKYALNTEEKLRYEEKLAKAYDEFRKIRLEKMNNPIEEEIELIRDSQLENEVATAGKQEELRNLNVDLEDINDTLQDQIDLINRGAHEAELSTGVMISQAGVLSEKLRPHLTTVKDMWVGIEAATKKAIDAMSVYAPKKTYATANQGSSGVSGTDGVSYQTTSAMYAAESAAKNQAKSLVSGGGIYSPATWFKFAKGGVVPGGYPNDSAKAMVSSKEAIFPAWFTDLLESAHARRGYTVNNSTGDSYSNSRQVSIGSLQFNATGDNLERRILEVLKAYEKGTGSENGSWFGTPGIL